MANKVLPNLAQENARLLAELEALKKAQAAKFKLKVSEKGALSVYGLQRFPVSLYREQWEAILENAEVIRDFIEANSDRLKTKGQDE